MGGRFWISVAVLFVVSMLYGFVVHGMLLRDDYAYLPSLFRSDTEAQRYFHWMLLAHLLLVAGFTWIYRKGREPEKPFLGQGLRFGLAVSVLMAIPMYLIYYSIQPWPGAVIAKQIAYDVIGNLGMGVIVAALNQEKARA